MSSTIHGLGKAHDTHIPQGAAYRVGIVVSRYYPEITEALKDGCINTLITAGVQPGHIYTQYAPGTYELPLAATWLYKHQTPDAIICLGCVIQGETRHFDFICHSVTDAIMQLGITHNTPFVFGVLTPNNMEQAQARAGGKHGNKGVEAAQAALEMIALKKKLFI